jgi:hypothetical protein
MFSSIDFLGSSPAKEVSKGFLITQISLRSFLSCSSFRDCAPALWGDSHSGCGEGQQVLCILEERARPVGGDGTSVPTVVLQSRGTAPTGLGVLLGCVAEGGVLLC